MEEMVLTLSPVKYGQLLSQTLPKRIETDEELDHFVTVMEELSRAIAHGAASPEETALHSLLATLVKEYDDRAHPLPPGDPVRMLQFLMDQRGLRAADLTPDRKSTRLNSSHLGISYAVFCLKKKPELAQAHLRSAPLSTPVPSASLLPCS